MNARARLARAIGQAEAGLRATVDMTGRELAGGLDLLRHAVSRLLPLVVRLSLNDGHATYHSAADTGAILLLARSAEELAALELLARLVTERTLLPVVVASEEPAWPGTGDAALVQAARELLGQASDRVASSTPAQELLFGRHRQRVPHWFDLERPVLRGAVMDPELLGRQRAGLAALFQASAAELLESAAADLESRIGRELAPVTQHATERAQLLIVAQGDAVRIAEQVARELGKPRAGVLGLRVLRPFPASLAAQLQGRRPVLVLERTDAPLAADAPLLREIRAAVGGCAEKLRPSLHSGLFGLGGAPLQAADLRQFCQELVGRAPRALVYLGVEFAPLPVALPKRQILHEQLRRQHPGLAELGLAQAPAQPGAATPVPAHRRIPPRLDATHDSATRHWDLVGAPLASGDRSALAPDPYLSAGSVPAATSVYRSVPCPSEVPEWEPAACTGCGRCWTACPDGAILPVVLPPATLLEAGVKCATAAGDQVDALAMVSARLAKVLPRVLPQTPGQRAGEALRRAAQPMLQKLGDDPRLPGLQAAVGAVAASLDPIALAVTEPFYGSAEQAQPGQGELLALVVDPDACKGCSACIAECEPGALRTQPGSREWQEAGRSAAQLWQELPDTRGSTIARVRPLPEPGVAAAVALSRHVLHALAPGDVAEPGSGAKIALRQVLAAGEAELQPRLRQHLQELAELRAGLATAIREQLAAALPTADLDLLAEGLAEFQEQDLRLGALATRLQEATDRGQVDHGKLTVLVATARELADLHWRVEQGATGFGRARGGLAVAGSEFAAAMVAYPWNPFTAPVAVDDSGESGELALGLLEGQVRALGAEFALVRRARALLAGKPPGPRALAWSDLTGAERALCPPLWLLADQELGRTGLTQLSAVLGSGLPAKVLLLVDPDLATGPDPSLLALAHRDAFVLQSSIADRDHLVSGTLLALRHPGPAVVLVHAPSPARGGFPPHEAIARARAAVAAGVWTLFHYDPLAEGTFGLRLQLATSDGAGIQTPLQWAAAQPRFARHFSAGAGGEPVPGSAVEAWARDRLQVRATLREWAGLDTPFTARVQAEAATAVAARHEDDLRARQQQHEQEMQSLRQQVEQELLQRLQRRLAALAGGRRP